MSDQGRTPDPRPRTTGATTPARDGSDSTGSRWWLLPLATFLAGLVLGAVVLAVTRDGGNESTVATTGPATTVTVTGAPGATGSPTSTEPGATPSGVTVTVPQECIELADDARAAGNLLEDAAAAARDLNADRLADIVRQMQTARQDLDTAAGACQNARGGATTQPSPTTS